MADEAASVDAAFLGPPSVLDSAAFTLSLPVALLPGSSSTSSSVVESVDQESPKALFMATQPIAVRHNQNNPQPEPNLVAPSFRSPSPAAMDPVFSISMALFPHSPTVVPLPRPPADFAHHLVIIFCTHFS